MRRFHPAALLLVVLAVACSSSTQTAMAPPEPEPVENVPDWFLSPPQDDNYLFGAATSTSQDMQLAINKAQTEGRNQLAQQLDVRFGGLARRFQEETGLGEDAELLDQFTQAYKAVTSEVLTGTRARDQEVLREGTIFRAYVLMEMPIGEASTALMAKIRERENMYTRFRATEAFEELEEEIARYEEWRNQQGGYR